MAGFIALSDYDALLSLKVKLDLKEGRKNGKMDKLVCDYCGKEIIDGDYIVTKYGEIYCDGDELLDVLEQEEYFMWAQKEEEE